MSSEDPTDTHAWRPIKAGEPRLLVLWDGGNVTHPLVERTTITIGRGNEADVQVLHPSVSRLHARFHVSKPLVVEDLRSRNGIRLNGRLLGAGERASFTAGDVLEIGAATVIIQHGEPTQAAGGAEEPMARLRRLVALVAKSSLSVLILGETGTGKEVTANAIHRASARASGPFIRLNCAAFTESLLESELFGHEKGAFTGAVTPKVGLVEAAHGGTLLLDEVGELPLTMQAKLLRVLETREVRRVGAVRSVAVDVRFIAATNRDLQSMVAESTFRSDLYFRLDGVTLQLPPLRERRGEILDLSGAFLEELSVRTGTSRQELTAAARERLLAYHWPGNVRELRNVLERAAVFAEGGRIDTEHLALPEPAQRTPTALPEEVERLELRRIIEALEQNAGNQTRAAAQLGIARRTLINRMEEYRLPRPKKRS